MATTGNITRQRTTAQRRPAAGNKNAGANRSRHSQMYMYDNTARQLDVRRAMEEKPKKRLSTAARKNRDRAVYMNLGYVSFLTAAMLVTAFVLINYLQLKSQITHNVEVISAKESQLYDLKLANDEEYSRITSSVDLEEIKRIAIGELGMNYAEEGQIVTYTNEGSDYVKQVAEMPSE